MTGQTASTKAFLYNLLSNLDSDAEVHVEFRSPKTTVYFGAPTRLEDADARLELKTNSGEEEEIRSICEKALQNNISPNSVDFKGIFEEPGEKTLFVEIKKSRNPGDGRAARILESDFGSQSEGRKSDGDVYEPRLADYILQQSAHSLLLSGQEDPHYMDIESGQVESTIGVNYMRRQDGTGSANEEMLETAHAIVNMADLKPIAAVPAEEYHEEGMPRRRQRVAVEPKELVGVPKECPRCKSKYVKFKYFNNKKLNQPRYQCLSCKDFFTHGGKKLATEAVSPSAGVSAVNSMLVEGMAGSIVPYQQVENKGKERKRKAKEPPQFANMEKLCRKCGSKNTAFKYLNNGQQDQPRYKCLDCKGMFQLHNKRVRPSSSGDANNATLLSDLSKETTSVESASAPHETLLMITGPRNAKQSERKRKAMEPEHLIGVIKPCPSCKKLKTRFKYFNNKNLNQPRYECLDCHSYFTYKGEFDQVRRDAVGGNQGAGTSTTTAVNEGKIESADGIGRDGRGKEVEEGNTSLTARSDSKLIFGTGMSRLDGEDVREGDASAMDSGDSRVRITDVSTGPGRNEGIGNNVGVRDTGEVINVQQRLDQIERREEEKDNDTTLEATDPRRLLDPPENLDTHDKEKAPPSHNPRKSGMRTSRSASAPRTSSGSEGMASTKPVVVPMVKLGSQGMEVSQQGLGCMGVTAFYGNPTPEEEGIKLIHHAVASGVTFFDTSEAYGPHTNEIFLGKAIKGLDRSKLQIASKFGVSVEKKGATVKYSVQGTPEYVHKACESSLKRLGVDYIDLYYQHRIDVNTPIEDTVGAMKELVEAGKVKYLGLSEASAADIRRAHAVHPITAVQLEWSLWVRDVEDEIIPTCRELGIGIVSYCPLGRGFLCGTFKREELVETDFRIKNAPRLVGENLKTNEKLLERVKQMAERKGCAMNQIALAWVQHQGVDVIPIPGTTKIANLDSNIASVRVQFSSEELEELSNAFPPNQVAGLRTLHMGITYQYVSTPPKMKA